MEKALKLYNSKGAFPSAENQIEILGFNYDAKRMGGAPTITAKVMYPTCLDGEWNKNVHVVFNGENYYLKQTPTSSKDNTNGMYKHDCVFVSERTILDGVYFLDAVSSNTQGADLVATNNATFSFFGTLYEFAQRLNASLAYSKLGYSVILDNLLDTEGKEHLKEGKLLSFDKNTIKEALDSVFNVFQIPYYFVGKDIYFDFYQEYIPEIFKYGFNNELLSVTKTNANNKVITRCTGTGSEENIPYYYPNKTPQGDLKALYNQEEGVLDVIDENLFKSNVTLNTKLTHEWKDVSELSPKFTYYNYSVYKKWDDNGGNIKSYLDTTFHKDPKKKDFWWATPLIDNFGKVPTIHAHDLLGSYKTFNIDTGHLQFSNDNTGFSLAIEIDKDKITSSDDSICIYSSQTAIGHGNDEFFRNVQKKAYVLIPFNNKSGRTFLRSREIPLSPIFDEETMIERDGYRVTKSSFTYDDLERNEHVTVLPFYWVFITYLLDDVEIRQSLNFRFDITVLTDPKQYLKKWYNKDGKIVELKDYGLSYQGTPDNGDTISVEMVEGSRLPFQTNLMPPIFLESKGTELFYNAKNGVYVNEDGKPYEFQNEYSESNISESIVEFPDIKPSIEYVKNANGENINTFIDFAYDDGDNNERDKDGKLVHEHFYAKLRKFGSYKVNIGGEEQDASFNLFTSASENGDITFSMTSGDCGACNFVLAVDEKTRKNTLQVDESGKLIFDEATGKPKLGEAQDRQNDTVNNEVWVALKKDESTFGTLMPTSNLKPKVEDTFVITNISFPEVYLREAEQRLKEAIIKHMYDNNLEKFTFSIKFSRIYLEENPEVLNMLNENSLIDIEYNGIKHTLFVNSFAYKKDADTALPEITVELADSIGISKNALQTAVAEAKSEVARSVQSMDIAAMLASKFVSKDREDSAREKITFNRGLNVGDDNETKAKIDEIGNADFQEVNFERGVVKSRITSNEFVDGFGGTGFRLWIDEDGRTNLTIDNITIRQSLRALELIITKLRAVNGGLFISAANGTIEEVTEDGDYYDIMLENENTFIAGDYMRCQVMSGIEQTDYWVEIESVNGSRCRVAKSEFKGALPLAGQEVVLDGSKNFGRQNAIYVTAGDDGKPRIDVLNGIVAKTHDGCLRTRLGSLDGVVDDSFIIQPNGDGLYSDNVFLKGDFILRSSGKSVETIFEIQDGKIKGSVAQTQSEAIKGKTLLYNASFTKGLDGWQTSNDEEFLLTGGNFLFTNGNTLKNSVTISNQAIYDNVFFVTINNGWIKQSNYSFINKPVFDSTKEYPLFFSTNIRCNEGGVLNVYLTNIKASNANTFIGYSDGEYVDGDYIYVNLPNNTSYALQLSEFGGIAQGDKIAVKVSEEPQLFNLTNGQEIPIIDWRDEQFGVGEIELSEPCTLICTKRVTESDDFIAIDIDDLSWNGQGDFYLECTGVADFYGLTIYTEKTEVRHRTLFEQTDKLIKLSSENFDANGQVLESSTIVTQAKMNAAFSERFDEDGKLIETAGLVTATDLSDKLEDYVDNAHLQDALKDYIETESFAGMFASAVEEDTNIVKQATLAAYVKEDNLGELVSKIDITADQIDLKGYNLTVDSANFKVREDGSIEAKNALLNGFLMQGSLYIDDDNYANFYKEVGLTWEFDVSNASPILIFKHSETPTGNINLILPYMDAIVTSSGTAKKNDLDYIRGFIGSSIIIYNYTNKNFSAKYTNNSGEVVLSPTFFKQGEFVKMNCKLGYKSGENNLFSEFIYWEVELSGKAIQYED